MPARRSIRPVHWLPTKVSLRCLRHRALGERVSGGVVAALLDHRLMAAMPPASGSGARSIPAGGKALIHKLKLSPMLSPMIRQKPQGGSVPEGRKKVAGGGPSAARGTPGTPPLKKQGAPEGREKAAQPQRPHPQGGLLPPLRGGGLWSRAAIPVVALVPRSTTG